jgi:hypothetical protein
MPLATLVLPATAHAAAGLQPVFEALLLGLAHVVLTHADQTNKARASSWTKRIVHVEAKVSQVINAVLTIAVYFYLYGIIVRLGSAQLAYLHAVIVFATFVFDFTAKSKVF